MAIRIYLGYKPADSPGGGANNFLRALYAELARRGEFEEVPSLDSDLDLIFMSQLNGGEGGEKHRIADILERKNVRGPTGRFPRLVVRAVNLRRHSYGFGVRTWWNALREDGDTLKLLNAADFVIFQSRYQQEFFTRYGFTQPSYRVIHNGANPIFLELPRRAPPPDEKILLVSATASPRASKRHDVIRAVADCKNVEVCHFGQWPSQLLSGNVKLMGVRSHAEMKDVYARAHGFVHPAVKDPCPNAVMEALASGLPILYGDGVGSSAELVGAHGIKLKSTYVCESLADFRAIYAEMIDQLEPNRSSYCVGRAAVEYSAVLEGLAS